jgi:hypothetical protein
LLNVFIRDGAPLKILIIAIDMALLRFAVSATNAVETAALATLSDATETDTVDAMDTNWLLRTVVSVVSVLLCAVFEVVMGEAVLTINVDADAIVLMRAATSVPNAVLMLELVEVIVDTDPLVEVERDDMDMLRAPTSVASAIENTTLVI